MLKRLYRKRVFTVEQLYAQSKQQLRDIWGGVVGERWWHWLRGEMAYCPPTHRSSLGHSHVLPPEFRTIDGAKAVLIRLIHRAAYRLRKEGYWARRMDVYVSFTYREEGWRGEVTLGLCQDTLTMIQALEQLWRFLPPGHRPTQVAITLLDLVADAYAPAPLFAAEQGRVRLAKAMDALNQRFGHNRIYFAGMGQAIATAPTRIAFSRVPALDDPDY
jgi:DNA polymerase IV